MERDILKQIQILGYVLSIEDKKKIQNQIQKGLQQNGKLTLQKENYQKDYSNIQIVETQANQEKLSGRMNKQQSINHIKNIINDDFPYQNLDFYDENTGNILKPQFILHNEKVYKQFRKTYNFDTQQFSKLVYQGLFNLKKSVGKSPCFFISTNDNQFMFKSLKTSEYKLFTEFFEKYVNYLKNNSSSFIVKYFGHVQIGQRHFLLMSNALQAKIPLNIQPKYFIRPLRIYDLKGSAIGRTAGPFDSIQKDNNFGRFIIVSQQQRLQFLQQLQEDTSFLQAHNFIDYSVLLGVTQSLERLHFQQINEQNEVKEININDLTLQLKKNNKFTFIALTQRNELVYVQIIDFLTSYGAKKRAELVLKGMRYRKERRDKLSVAPPEAYKDRLNEFFGRIIRNCDLL